MNQHCDGERRCLSVVLISALVYQTEQGGLKVDFCNSRLLQLPEDIREEKGRD